MYNLSFTVRLNASQCIIVDIDSVIQYRGCHNLQKNGWRPIFFWGRAQWEIMWFP